MSHSNFLKSNCIPQKKLLSVAVTLFILVSASTVFCADILLVTGTRPYAGDAAILENLENRGFTVTVVSDRDAGISDAVEKDLVVISESVYSKRINTTFRNLPVPIIVSEPWLFHYMGMTGSTYGTDFGKARRQSAITVTEFSHQMTAEMTGNVFITYRRRALSWGLAGKAAIKIATLIDDTRRCPIFAYDKGIQMPGMVAPDKRVGFFLRRNTAAYLTPEGWALFDTAVDWCLTPDPPVPVTFTIVSDESWKTCAGEGCNNVKKWPAAPEAPSHWKQAVTGFAHLKHPSEMRPGTEAKMMWFCPPGVDPQSSSIPSMAYFHKTFNLPTEPQQITRALVYVANPGRLSLYINGHPILVEGPTLGEGGKPRVFNIRHALKENQNVIAMVAQCGEAAAKYVFFDMAVEAMVQPTAGISITDKTLLVVGRTPSNYSDRQIKMRLEGSGHLVEVINDDQLEHAETADLKLIVISESVWSQLVGDRFTRIDVPVICFESYLYDDLRMTAAQPKKDYGNWRRQNTIYLSAIDEPIWANHQGPLQVTSRSGTVGWGIPAKTATIIAFLNRFSDKAAIFTYDEDAQLVDGMPAPARRLGMFPHKNSAKWFTDSGWALFDAAVVWATQE